MADVKVWAAKIERVIDGQVRQQDQSTLRTAILSLMKDAYDEGIVEAVTVAEKRQLVAIIMAGWTDDLDGAVELAEKLIERVK